jgi:putative transposase
MSAHDISQRQACRLVGVDPKTVRRTVEPDHPEIRARLREIAGERRRFGYRRIGLMLAREGIVMNHKKLLRLYREEGLSVRRRRGRKRATGTRQPLVVPARPGQRWSLDFLSDTFGPARRFRILGVIDDCSRECMALIADTSLTGVRVARELDAVVRVYGKPETIVSDNGTDQPSDAGVANRNRRWLALYRAGQTDPERLHRRFQRASARRTPERRGL